MKNFPDGGIRLNCEVNQLRRKELRMEKVYRYGYGLFCENPTCKKHFVFYFEYDHRLCPPHGMASFYCPHCKTKHEFEIGVVSALSEIPKDAVFAIFTPNDER